MRIIQDDLWLCECCMFAAVNGDSCDCPDGHDSKLRPWNIGEVFNALGV